MDNPFPENSGEGPAHAGVWLKIGKLGKPHGVSGEIKLYSWSDVPGRFAKLKRFWCRLSRGKMQNLEIAAVRPLGPDYAVKFTGYDSRESVSALAGGELILPDSERGRLPRGHFFYDQLVGLRVQSTLGEDLGRVVEVLDGGANHVLTVSRDGKEWLLPWLAVMVRNVDLKKKQILVEIPAGLSE